MLNQKKLDNKILTAKERFSATLNSNATDGTFDGVYDDASGIAQINCTARFGVDVSTNATIYTLPSGYRPKVSTSVPAIVVTSGGTIVAFFASINIDGSIKQLASGSARQIYICGSYKVK